MNVWGRYPRGNRALQSYMYVWLHSILENLTCQYLKYNTYKKCFRKIWYMKKSINTTNHESYKYILYYLKLKLNSIKKFTSGLFIKSNALSLFELSH